MLSKKHKQFAHSISKSNSCVETECGESLGPSSNNDAALTLTTDRTNFTVTYNGKSCFLGYTMAFRLLERLAEARGIFLPINTFIEDVWGGKNIGDEAVQRQVSTLRAKFRAAGINGIHIEAQPGHYRLILR